MHTTKQGIRSKLRRTRRRSATMVRAQSLPILGVAVVLIAAPLAAPVAAVVRAAPGSAGVVVNPKIADGSLNEALNELRSGLSDSAYGGLDFDRTTAVVTVMTLGPASAAVEALAARVTKATGISVTFKVGRRSIAYLKALQARIGAEMPVSIADRLRTVSIDVGRGQVDLGVASATADDQQLTDHRYGEDVQVSASDGQDWQDRYGDTAPYYGGDRLLHSYNSGFSPRGTCSYSFGATYSAHLTLMTAGHCAPYGVVPTPTYVANGRTQGDLGCAVATCSFHSIGTIWQTRLKTYASMADAQAAAPSLDMALITGSTPSTYVWAQGSNTAVFGLTTFPGANRTPDGYAVCHSGATSWGDCGVVAANPIIFGAVVTTSAGTGYARASLWPVSFATCPGDSGGTVYVASTHAFIGHVSAAAGAGCSAPSYITYWGDADTAGFYPGIVPYLG